MKRCRLLVWALLLATLTALLEAPASAAPTREQREKIESASRLLKKAGNLYLRKRYQESGEAIRELQALLEELTKDGDPEMIELLKPVYQRVANAHKLLKQQGVELPPLKPLPEPRSTPQPAEGGVSFVKQVAPILVSKCGRCHVAQARGMFSMQNFAALMRGTPDGKVIFPGDPDGSRIVEVIVEGDMPRGGGRVAAEELELLKTWIKEGAKFDGPDPDANLSSLAPGAAPMQVARLDVTPATGKETVSFARDIAPVLVASCSGCHVNPPRRAEGGLNMTTIRQLLRGGDSGPPLVPGKPGESLLVAKLKGTASGQRMPRGRPPLPNTVIAKIETWIAEGARYDGDDPNQRLDRLAAVSKALAMSHEELSLERKARALDAWRLGMPGINPEVVETEDLLLIGNVGENTLKDLAQKAQSLVPRIAQLFHHPAKEPLVKGRITLYCFQQRYDYSEFGRMVEKRDLPPGRVGHWRFDQVDAYGALIPSRSDQYSNEALLAQQIAGAYVASLGEVPHWFAEGAARAAAARIADDDPRVEAWEDGLAAAIAAMGKPDDFLTGNLPPEQADIVSYSFVKFLMTDSKRFSSLLAALRAGQPFPAAFSRAYGSSPSQVAQVWVRSAPKRTPRRRSSR